jgi:HlyD family secretion protein
MALKKKTTGILIIIGVLALVLLIVARKAGWIGEGEETKVSVQKAALHTIVETISASGKVQPEIEVKLSSDVSGELVELFVKEGDVVKKGDLMAKINPEIYKSNRNRMEASVNSSKANLGNTKSRLRQTEAQFVKAQQDYNRSKELYDEGVISASDFESAKASYEVAKADVEAGRQSVAAAEYGIQSAEASFNEANENLNKTSIFAPVSGTVSKLSVEKGERVVGTELMAGTEVMRLANLNEMEVSVDVSETDIIRVSLGDTADVDIDAYMDRNFVGVVTEMANSANLESSLGADQVTNFTVKVRILRSSYKDLIPEADSTYSPFRPGMSATVEIQTNKVYNTLSVPIQAVTTRDTSSESLQKDFRSRSGQDDHEVDTKSKSKIECVFVTDNGKVKLTPVKTGIQDNFYIQIVEGINDNDEVVVAPYNAISRSLDDGEEISVVAKEDLYKRDDKK